jgi:hypothetical protein
MQEKDSQHIQTGPGGLILNVKANEKLLKEIRRTDPLPSPDLLKLADFFRVYMTDVPLGNHLELVGLRQIIYEPGVQKALITAGYTVRSLPVLDLPEWLEAEDLLHPGDEPNERGQEDGDPPDDGQSVQVAWISFSRVGLLIEIAHYRAKDGTQRKRYYVIGVSPNPSNLQTDAQVRVVRVRINKEADPVRNEQD